MQAPSKLIILVLLLHFFTSGFTQGDFGDAPDPPYPTSIANNGAFHPLISTLWLGASVDGEAMPTALPTATGDDFSGTDDEDGVSASTWLAAGSVVQLKVVATQPGLFSGWIDFNSNGSWADVGEQVCMDAMLTAGINSVSINIPANIINGQVSYARFRLTSQGGIGPAGTAPDGEVEDYWVYLGTPPSGVNVITPDPFSSFTQNEISLNKVQQTGTLIAAFNNHPVPGGPGLGIARSTDQGANWTISQLQYPMNSIAGVSMVDAFDPSITSDEMGNIYAAHIATDFNWASGPISGLYVHKSANDGVSWQTPVQVDIQNTASGSTDSSYRFNDRCQIRADVQPHSPHQGNVYLAWIQDRGWNIGNPLSDIYVSRSTDRGSSYSSALRINDTNNYNMGNLPNHDVAANGDVYVLWVDYNVLSGGVGTMLFDKSSDGGITWGQDRFIDSIQLPPINLNGGLEVRAKGAAIIRAHPTDSNTLYICYAADPDTAGPDEADIFFIKSTDGGNNWSNPIQVNDDTTSQDQILPWMEVSPAGLIRIAWYDRRMDPTDLFFDVYTTYSKDEGATFDTNQKINTFSFRAPTAVNGIWFGEYLGLAMDTNKTYVAYTTNATDPSGDIAFGSVNDPIITHINVNDAIDGPEVLVYPVPARDYFTVLQKGSDHTLFSNVRVYSLLGEILLEDKLYERRAVISIPNLPPGNYIIQLSNKNGIVTKRLLKL